ncbi:MAG: hypothetical protein ABWY27_00655 [Telluria sp.]
MINRLRSGLLRFFRTAGAHADRGMFRVQRYRYYRNRINYTSEASEPLLTMLNRLFAQYGFESAPRISSDTPDIAVWQKSLGPTLKAELSMTLHPALPPNVWSLDPMVLVDSAYVGYWYNKLRLYRDFYPVMSEQADDEYLQVLRYSPAHIRWQERLDLEVHALKGRPETIDQLRDDFTDVFERYVIPLLERFRDPLVLAEFQLRAETEFRSTRISWDEPRYKVSNPYISTALLFDEAGETARAITFLEQAREELSRQWAAEDPARTKPKYGQLDRLLEHLRNKAVTAAPSD